MGVHRHTLNVKTIRDEVILDKKQEQKKVRPKVAGPSQIQQQYIHNQYPKLATYNPSGVLFMLLIGACTCLALTLAGRAWCTVGGPIAVAALIPKLLPNRLLLILPEHQVIKHVP